MKPHTKIKKEEFRAICDKVYCIGWLDFTNRYFTDLKNVYLISLDCGNDDDEDSLWFCNSNSVAYCLRPFDPVNDWNPIFSLETAKHVVNTDRKILLEEMSNVDDIQNRYYAKKPCNFRGECSEKRALFRCMIDMVDVNLVTVTENVKMLYANGKSIFTGKPLELWSDRVVSVFGISLKVGNLNSNVLTLLQHALDSPKSEWRVNKKWEELYFLDHNDPGLEISDFTTVAADHKSFIDGFENKEAEYAITKNGRFLLLKVTIAYFCGDGDVNTYLFLKENTDLRTALTELPIL